MINLTRRGEKREADFIECEKYCCLLFFIYQNAPRQDWLVFLYSGKKASSPWFCWGLRVLLKNILIYIYNTKNCSSGTPITPFWILPCKRVSRGLFFSSFSSIGFWTTAIRGARRSFFCWGGIFFSQPSSWSLPFSLDISRIVFYMTIRPCFSGFWSEWRWPSIMRKRRESVIN